MKHIHIASIPGYDDWRSAARDCLAQGIPPQEILWQSGTETQAGLFSDPVSQGRGAAVPSVPKSFLTLAETACCHADPRKFALLYKILWRLCHENRGLLHLTTDDDILRLSAMVKAVRKDAYKITAFLRFREVVCAGEEYFVAWYEPEHYTLERVLNFFQTRFRNMRWSILMPYRAAHWNGEVLVLEDNPDPALYPREDTVERYWLGYYASIFNPARLKKSAMLNQMPKKYWGNMPETALVPDLLRGADERVRKMIEKSEKMN